MGENAYMPQCSLGANPVKMLIIGDSFQRHCPVTDARPGTGRCIQPWNVRKCRRTGPTDGQRRSVRLGLKVTHNGQSLLIALIERCVKRGYFRYSSTLRKFAAHQDSWEHLTLPHRHFNRPDPLETERLIEPFSAQR
jgi:hypothetical protein